MKSDWHIFCRVVDNFGDIGVSWRLATRLHAQGGQVTLIVDDLASWRCLIGNTTALTIEVLPWQEPLPPPARCVIEAFGCGLPESYRARMPERTQHWFILDYFSAEPWVPGFHGAASPQHNGLTARFIYPSVRLGTGGLLREDWYDREHHAFHQEGTHWRTKWCIPEPAGDAVFLFGYEQPALSRLLADWAADNRLRTVYLAAGRLLDDTRRQLGLALLPGAKEHWGRLTLVALPFIPQREFDRLLWQSDFAVVRGEDSLARAIWSGKPFIWHIYPTEDGAHWTKLDALFAEFGEELDDLEDAAFTAWQQINRDWNHHEYHAAHWAQFDAMRPRIAALCTKIAQRLTKHSPELANTFLEYTEK